MQAAVKIILISLASILGAILSLIILYLLVLFISSLFVDTKRVYDKHSKYYRFLLNSFTAISIRIMRIKIHVTGAEKLEELKGSRFLIVQNHRSNYDPILTWYVLRKYDVAFLSKEANLRIPIFGKLIRKCCFMVIDRENPREALKSIIKAAELIKNDQVSIGVYPEGTRNKGDDLLPFHNGVFKVAQLAKVPIVISTAKGMTDISKQYIRKKTDVYIDFTGILTAEEISKMNTKEIGEIVEGQMREALSK